MVPLVSGPGVGEGTSFDVQGPGPSKYPRTYMGLRHCDDCTVSVISRIFRTRTRTRTRTQARRQRLLWEGHASDGIGIPRVLGGVSWQAAECESPPPRPRVWARLRQAPGGSGTAGPAQLLGARSAGEVRCSRHPDMTLDLIRGRGPRAEGRERCRCLILNAQRGHPAAALYQCCNHRGAQEEHGGVTSAVPRPR